MDFVSILKVADLGITALVIIALLVVFLRIYPKWMVARSEQFRALLSLASEVGGRVVAAQEKQADSISQLTKELSARDATNSRCMDDLQIAIGGVGQHTANLHGELVKQGQQLAAIGESVNALSGDITGKLNELLKRS